MPKQMVMCIDRFTLHLLYFEQNFLIRQFAAWQAAARWQEDLMSFIPWLVNWTVLMKVALGKSPFV
jgi:hypothetical protein